MTNKKNEDFEDSQEVKRQKQDRKRTSDEFESWEPGKGIVKPKSESKNVRS